MHVGSAWIDITPSKPLPVAGQMHVRIGEYKHDPLTVNAVAFRHDGLTAVVVSCDLTLLLDEFNATVRSDCRARYGLDALMIACTHSHVAPCTTDHLPGWVDADFMRQLHESLVAVVGRAIEDLEACEVYAGKGHLSQMGFNRRGVRRDGTAGMYYGSWNDDFDHVEGPRDPEVGVLFAHPVGKDFTNLKVIIPSFSTHPNSVEGEQFYSADVAGAVRQHLRNVFGPKVGVVYLTGAAGNTAPSNLLDRERKLLWRGELGLKRSGLYLGSEITKVIMETLEPMADPVLRYASKTLSIPLRPWPEGGVPCTFGKDYYEKMEKEWPRILREQSPAPVPVCVLRVGRAAICTNPCELFVEFGLAIKKDSPADVTLIAELTNGYAGYVPTEEAFAHGGYCTWPAISSKLDVAAGRMIVEQTGELLREVLS